MSDDRFVEDEDFLEIDEPEQAHAYGEVVTARQQQTPLTDELVREATGGWRRTLGPLLDEVKKVVQESKDADDCKKRLAKLSLSKDELTEAIASVTFRARAVGDAGRR